MCDIKKLSFSLLFLYAFEISTQNPAYVSVDIKRSPSAIIDPELALQREKYPEAIIEPLPSATRGLMDFIKYIEDCVISAENEGSAKPISLDFNTKLIGLFNRLENAPSDTKAYGKIHIEEGMAIIAKHTLIKRLSLVYDGVNQLKFVSWFISPFIETIEELSIQPVLPIIQNSSFLSKQ